jgi:cellulose synthase/poly-beta-1,6-N-acetylglucosamine synthase-like glycosyltransferase
MNPWIAAFALLGSFQIVIGGIYLFREFLVRRNRRLRRRLSDLITSILAGDRDTPKGRAGRFSIMNTYIELRQSVSVEGQGHKALMGYFVRSGVEIALIRGLSSRVRFRRIRSGFSLGFLPTERSFKALLFAFEREKSPSGRFVLASALSEQGYMAAIPTLIDSLRGADSVYRERLSGLLLRFGSGLLEVFPILKDRPEKEIQDLFLQIAKLTPSDLFEKYLSELLTSKDETLRREAFGCIISAYPHLIDPHEYIYDDDPAVRTLAIEGLAGFPDEDNFRVLIDLAGDDRTREAAVLSLSNLIGQSGSLFLELYRRFVSESKPEKREALLQILSRRLEYFLPRITGSDGASAIEVLKAVAREGHWSSIIGFLNINRNEAVENAILGEIQGLMTDPSVSIFDLQVYLDRRLLEKLGLEPKTPPSKRLNEKKETIRRWPLVMILVFIGIILPVVLLVRWITDPWLPLWPDLLKTVVNDFLTGFGFYGMVLNSFYLLLFLFSFINAQRQYRYLHLKQHAFLFRKGVLPSLSIIAPAFNEEATIIESVHSLLNLDYPEYEVIVVNDGSPDRTLSVLIETFDLFREDRAIPERLKTQPVRGIYVNPALPRLIVVDKVNGGKADSLNAGINISRNRYFAAIDSDSLLERDALWKVTASFLDFDDDIIASGGNILPVNGSRVRLGHLEKIGIPLHPVALFQTIEYIRAFMNGRIGWSFLNSLLIISGAFGIFNRERVIEARGYLTSREAFEKDTVGEDMELVVRLIRTAREKGRRERALYVPSANCWTEVPESFKVLGRQRERWQRGLIDILIFHKAMLFNPRYGLMGLAAFPYYLVFELIGPWYEFLSGLVFFAALGLGWIELPVLLFVILANLSFSVLISLSALLIADWEGSPFRLRDRIVLVFSAIFENFGFRELMAFYRLSGFVSVLRNVTGWGKMTRKGFKK